jgi:polysaccharide biosynthesis transport protein
MHPGDSDKMSNQPEGQAPPGIKLDDIYFVLFRHKWTILFCTIAGLLAAGIVYFLRVPIYKSEAKLLVRYILENKSVNPVANEAQIKSPNSGGETIINTEMEILTSLDLATQIADVIGPEKIVGKRTAGIPRDQAAAAILKNLSVDAPRKGNIISIVFQHSNPEIVQPVLDRLIEAYLKRHVQIHQALGMLDDFLAQQTDQIRSRLTGTEDELRILKNKTGIVSLEESKKAYVGEMSKIRQELFSAEAELEERKVAAREMEKLMPSKSEEAATEFGVPLEQLNEYRSVCVQFDSLWTRQRDLLTRFKDAHPLVQSGREQISELAKLKKKMEEENPKLSTFNVPTSGTNVASLDLPFQKSRITALEAKIKTFTLQMEKIRSEGSGVYEAESSITQLQRKRDLDETNYRFYSASLEQARINEALGAGKVSNIGVVQAPSPPMRSPSKTLKSMAMALAGGVFGGVGWAFLIELLLDQSIKRPRDVKSKLGLPLFLCIPEIVRKGGTPFIKLGKNGQKRLGKESERSAVPLEEVQQNPALALSVWKADVSLGLFYDALRDQLVSHFELRNMTRKPKLVAVTGCSKGAGVTTIASGLAASLSETGDGNVLLVDMNFGNGSVHPFFKGRPAFGLPDALENDKRDGALVQQNLYVASGNVVNGKMPRILPKKFTHLVPKINASDYDYIIFDMPSITQTSITSKLAGFMDIVLLVLESEKTNLDLARQSTSLLLESRANVAAVLNKSRKYVPEWLHPEL